NTNNAGPGSLRSALAYARSRTSSPVATTITFQIPKSDPGFDGAVFTIRPLSALPDLPGGTSIEGASQTLFTGHTNPAGPVIVLSGSQLGSASAPGLILKEPNCSIRDLVIAGVPQQVIVICGNH